MIKPEVFKSKHLGLGDGGADLNLARNMIRSWPGHWEEQSIWELSDPVDRGENLVNLF